MYTNRAELRPNVNKMSQGAGALRARQQAKPNWIEALPGGREPGPTMRHRRLRRHVAFRYSCTDYRTGVRQEQVAALVCTCITWGRAGVARRQNASKGQEMDVWTLPLGRCGNRPYLALRKGATARAAAFGDARIYCGAGRCRCRAAEWGRSR